MILDEIHEGLTFDDVLLEPSRSEVLPAEVDTRTCMTRQIGLNVPIVSAAMDTVTESHLAIALAQQGGIGIVHRNMPIERQAEEVDRVKRSESGMIVDPITIRPERSIADAQQLMSHYRISGVPVTKDGKLVGILTNRDLRFETRLELPISEVMTKENLVTVPVGTTLEQADAILHKHRVEKLLVVDDHYNLKGLITVKDIQKKLKYPNSAKDRQGRLRVGAAIGATGDFLERAQELVARKVDVLAIDTAHGHSTRVMAAVKTIKSKLPGGAVDHRQRGHLRRRQRADFTRSGRRQGGHWPRLHLHHAGGLGRRRAADHRHCRVRAGHPRRRRAADRGWRHQVLRRHHQAFAFPPPDNAIIEHLETLTHGETPALLQMDAKDFAALIPLLVHHERITLGKSSAVEVAAAPFKLPLRAALEANGEIVLSLPEKPAALVLAGDWVWRERTLQPLGLPPE